MIGKSGIHQLGLAELSAAVFGLRAVPLELQRRIVNDAIKSGATRTILWLAVAYAGVALLEQGFKLALNVYRGWVAEDAVRTLRRTIQDAGVPLPGHESDAPDRAGQVHPPWPWPRSSRSAASRHGNPSRCCGAASW